MNPDRFWSKEKIPPLDANETIEEVEVDWSGGPTFCGFLADKRRELGLTQDDVVQRMRDLGRVSNQPTLSRWESGKRQPDSDVLWYLFSALQLLPYERLMAIEMLASR